MAEDNVLERLHSVYKSATAFVVIRGKNQENEGIVESGTGFFISSSGYMLTNYHLLADDDLRPYSDIRIRAQQGSAFDPDDPTGIVLVARVIKYDPVQDIALLKAEEKGSPYNFVRACRETQVKDAESVYVLGYDLGLGLKPTPGTLSGKDSDRGYWQYTAQIEPGSSGGPVFNKNGRLIGINWGNASPADAINFMIPIQHSFDFFALAGAPLDYCKTTTGEEIQNSCVPIVKVFGVNIFHNDHAKEVISTKVVNEEYNAEPGHRIISWQWQAASNNNTSEVRINLIEDGRRLVLQVGLSSGPFYDRWGGRLEGHIITRQEKIECR
jgi:hypothetical protein